MFYINKYVPTSLEEIFFHYNIYKMLEIMSNDTSIPHLLFHGPYGSGKKTMINIFMEMLFGKSVHSVKNVKYLVSGSGNTESEEEFKQSFHHIFIEPKGNNHDRYLIHDVIKKYVLKARYNLVKTKHNFKLVVINNVDIMSESVQFSLRRTIEKYSSQCRFIIISNSISKIIDPIVSRCKCILVKSPDETDIIDYANQIAIKENINLTLDRTAYILNQYNGNIKNVLWRLEMYKLNDINLEKIKNDFIDIKNLMKNINIDFDDEYFYKILNDNECENVFIYKSINRFINNFGNQLYNEFKKLFSPILPRKQFELYFLNPFDFMMKVKHITNKKIKLDKKTKVDEVICKIGLLYIHIINTIKLLDPLLPKDYTVRVLYRYIKMGDLKLINDIRHIIFNLLITNISGTNIIKILTDNIVNDESIHMNKKIKIIDVCREAEYGVIKGRREINQFDNLIVSIINIITL